MFNVFPRAERAAIEQTIGYQMPNASPPTEQTPMPPSSLPCFPEFHPHLSLPSWFSRETVSALESSLFPEPEYRVLRNTMLDSYSAAHGPLSLSSCASLGPFAYVLRIFNFLEDNNMINYEIDLKLNLLDLKSLEPFSHAYNNKNMNETESPIQSIPASPVPSPKNISQKRYITRDFLNGSRCDCGNKAEFFTSDLFFICSSCLSAERYPQQYTHKNFHQITPRLLQSLWTKKDEYLLLRNIELYGDNWQEVTSGLNKTPEECIFHFIKMSLIDECREFPSLCFGSVPNPISTLVAYVAYMIHPVVACEVANKAIKCIDRANLIEILLTVAVNKSAEILNIEKTKLARVKQVGIEAQIIKIGLKIDALKDMYEEVGLVRAELEVAREKLLEEAAKK